MTGGRPRRCALVVDSGAVIPEPPPGTTVIPLHIVIGGHAHRDGVDVAPADFYRRLEAGERPTTSTPSPGEYLQAFQDAPADAVVCLTIPARLSAMYDSASLAARLLAEGGDRRPVTVIDTGTAAAGFGLVARVAAERCATGAPVDQVVERVRAAAAEVRMYGTLRTLTYLARSGRVPSIAAIVSGALDVHPVFELRAGDVHHCGLVRTRHHVREAFQRLAVEQFSGGPPLWVLTFHSNESDEAKTLLEAIAAVVAVGRAEVIPLTPAMGAYTGPGMTGFAAMPLR